MSIDGGGDRAPSRSVDALRDLTDLVVVIRMDGTITYLNPFAEQLLGFPLDEGLGTNIAEFVHPDDLVRALEVMGLMADDSLLAPVTPAEYRLRHRTGGWRTVEVNATILGGPDGDEMLLLGRHSGDRDIWTRIVELITAGAATEDVVALLPGFGTWRHPEDHYGVLWTDDRGDPATAGSLLAFDGPVEVVPGSVVPWEDAAASGREQSVAVARLPPALRDVAVASGWTACWAVPVPDPLWNRPAVLVAWTREGGVASAAHRYTLQSMERALLLIHRWRQQRVALESAARRDPLTGVGNRTSFFDDLAAAAGAGAGDPVGVLYVDLDGFKQVNDEFGHATGDRILEIVARRLAAAIRPSDTLARLGGDEFAVICSRLDGPEDAEHVARRILAVVAEPFDVDGTVVTIGASVGVAVGPGTADGDAADGDAADGDAADGDAADGDALLRAADSALYVAKAAGRGRWHRAD